MIYDEDGVRLYHGDAVEVLASLPAESVDCVVTSPPYWGLRAYSGEQQSAWAPEGYGAEPTPELYVGHTVEVLRAIRRVLKPSGVVWWNVGDTYAGGGFGGGGSFDAERPGWRNIGKRNRNGAGGAPGLKPKDLVLIPFRVALAAQADGWWVRSDVIWAKPNPMPESVTDRPTKAHEYVFLLTKSERYAWDQDAVREPLIKGAAGSTFTEGKTAVNGLGRVSLAEREDSACGRNIRSVWTIATQPSPLPHFAAFPDELAERCIKAACPVGGVVLDPFAGTGTTLKVARGLGRQAIGIEISQDYCELVVQRLRYGTRGTLAVRQGQGTLWEGG